MIGERIKTLRKALGLSQTDFAARIGTVQNTITGYETGRREPSNQVLTLICREFRVSEDWLRTGEGEMFVPTPTTVVDQLCEEYDLDGAARVVLEKIITLPPEEQEVIIQYMCSVVDAIRAEKTEAEKLHAQLDAELNVERVCEAARKGSHRLRHE